jgi:hypothetical protein
MKSLFSRFLVPRLVVAAVLSVFFLIGAKVGAVVGVAAYLAADALARQALLGGYSLGASTTVANLWNPSVWIPGLAERIKSRPSLINSGIMVNNADIQAIVDGPSTIANIPFFKEPDFDDAIQAEDSDVTVNNVASGKQVATILNRRFAIGTEALAKAVSGADPVAFALDIWADFKLRRRQKSLLNILRGTFGNADGPGAGTAAFKAVRKDIFSETGASPTSEKLFSSDFYIETLGLMGENKPDLTQCVICCHSKIEEAMLKQDDITVVQDSLGKDRVQTYKGAPVFVSDLLSRAGGTSGTVYDTYIFKKGSVGYGERTQSNTIGDVAAMIKIENALKNTTGFADFSRFVIHPNGAVWGGTPAGQSATNTELAVAASWTLAYGDVKNVGIVALRSNG